MEFTSYRDAVVATAAALVNHLTAGVDGTHPVDAPADTRSRRARARQITAFAGGALPTAELAGLVDLAARLRPVFERCDAGDLDGAARLVNDLLRRYNSAPQLIRHDEAPWHLHFHSERAGMADGYGAGCATGLAMVIGGGDADRLGVCTSAPCDRVFVDTSRNGNRRFCSPRCANRAGVVAFRARERSRGRAGLTE